MVGARSFFRNYAFPSHAADRGSLQSSPGLRVRRAWNTKVPTFRNYLNNSPVRKSVTTQFSVFYAGAGPSRLGRPGGATPGLGLSAWLAAIRARFPSRRDISLALFGSPVKHCREKESPLLAHEKKDSC